MKLFSLIARWATGSSDTGNLDADTRHFPDVDSGLGAGVFEDHTAINPANGLPMIGGTAGVDVAGNPYGADSFGMDSSFGTHSDPFDSSSGFGSW